MGKEQELLQAVLDARRKVDDLDNLLSMAKDEKAKAEAILIELMQNADMKSFRSATLGVLVVSKEQLYVSIVPDQREEAYRWVAEDCGRPDMIKPSIHNKTLTSFVSERLKNAEQIPADMFKYYFKPELAITQAK